jgi:hypothetical protein
MKTPIRAVLQRDRANITFLMLIAGLLYSSWPLGYWLNPNAAKGLASDLEALHQPFNWLFIALDILTGLFVAIACFKLSQIVRANSHPKTRLGLWVGVVGVASFGIITAIDAILPLNCLEGSPHCIDPLQNPYYIIHGIFSIGSIAGLTLSIIAIWLLLYLRVDEVRSKAHMTPAAFLLIWSGFGGLTLYLVLHNRSSTMAQHFFISFCSLWLVALPYFIGLVIRLQPAVIEL